MLRLDLYGDTYSLTEWRCAAFVWMLLVATGLVLIIARIALGSFQRAFRRPTRSAASDAQSSACKRFAHGCSKRGTNFPR